MVAAVALTACGDDSASTPATTSPGNDAEESAGEPGSGATTTAGEATTSTTTAPMPPSESELAAPLGLDSMVILTPVSGGGDRPDLAWEPVSGAALYHVTLLAPDGTVYWGWSGSETSVPVGGFPRLVPEATGPRIIADMSWTVTATGVDDVPIAVGGPSPLSP